MMIATANTRGNDGPAMLATLVPASARRLTAHELVHKTLRRAVLSGALPGGTRLVQADIAAQLEVSTTPVREALRDLATEGLIQLDAHRGAIVRSIDVEEMREIYELRILLEPLAVRRAVEAISEEDLDHAAQLVEDMEAAEGVAWVELNRRFHRLMLASGEQRRLEAIIRSLQESAAMYVGLALHTAPEIQGKGVHEHRAMLDAYRRRDAEAAVASTVEHLETTLAAITGADPGGGESAGA